MRSFSKKLAFVLAAAMVVTAFAPAAKAEAAKEMAINKQDKILYVTDGGGINDAAQVGGGKGNVAVYDFSVKNKPADWKKTLKFEWSSSDEDVVSVQNGGVATAEGVGKATIYCKVTEKATNEVTTLKTKVTVKANAAKVEIINAEDWDGATVEANGVVDLNRAMYDADGNKTTKRGTLVTDYTKWVAEPATGVTIDQKTGKFTFSEDAVAGEYKLSCYTYQSSKYPKAIVKSDAVVVEFLKADKFEVDQTASNGFDLVFGKEANVAIADVTVNKIIKVGETTGKIPMVVSGVTMSEDKKAANVSLFTNFENGVAYEISVKGYEDIVTLTAFVGKPVSMTISSKSGIQNGMFVTINTETELTYSLFDEQGNDVTNTIANTNVFFTTANYNVNDYYVSGKTIYIFKEGVQAAVNAEFHTADGKLTASAYFVGVNATPITIKSASLGIERSWGAPYANNTAPVSDEMNQWGQSEVYLAFKVQTTHPDDTYAKNYNSNVKSYIPYLGYDHWIEFRSTNPDVADIVFDPLYDANGAVMEGTVHVEGAKLRLFKEGTTAILADIVTYNPDGSKNVFTVTSCYVTVGGARAYQKLEHFNSNGHITVGTEKIVNADGDVVENYATGDLIVLAKDQYGDCLSFVTDSLTYTFADKSTVPAGTVTHSYRNGWQNYFTVDGSLLENKIPANATSKQFYINVKGKVDDAMPGDSYVEFSFVVTVKKPGNGATTISVTSWSDMPNGTNVGRFVTPYDGNDNTERVKKTTFQAFKMNNGIRVGQVSVAPKTTVEEDAVLAAAYAEANPGETLYFYTVESGSVDFTNRDADIVSLNGKDVVLKYSQTEDVTMYKDFEVVTGSAVIYRTDDWKSVGNGTYVYTLYKMETRNGNNVYTQVGATTASATLDTEKYSFVKRTSEVAEFTDKDGNYFDFKAAWGVDNDYNQHVLRNCFEIVGRDGNATNNQYYVKAKISPKYVFVESITFFESLGNGEYASYTVNVNVSLVLPQTLN